MTIAIRRRTWVEREADPVKRLEAVLDEGVATLDLGVRVINALEAKGVVTIRDLLYTRREDLAEVRNLGAKTMVEIFKALAGLGFLVPEELLTRRKAKRMTTKTTKAAKTKKTTKRAAKVETPAEKVSVEFANRRAIGELRVIADSIAERLGEEDELIYNLAWVVSGLKTCEAYEPVAPVEPAEDEEPTASAVAVVAADSEEKEPAEEEIVEEEAAEEEDEEEEDYDVDDDEEDDYNEDDEEAEDDYDEDEETEDEEDEE